MKKYRFPKSARLLTSAEFDRVFEARCSASDRNLVVYAARGEAPQPRLGIVASRKLGGAVMRNRWKRILREAFRHIQTELPEHVEIVVLPRQGVEPELMVLQHSLKLLVARTEAKLPKQALP